MRRLARILGVAATAALLSIGVAAAAGQNTSTRGFGATTTVVASCGAGMTFAYTTSYQAGIPGYAVNGISVTNIPADCLGKNLSVTFYDGSNGDAAVGSTVTATLPPSGTTQSISIDSSTDTIDARLVTGLSVVVS